MNNLDFTKFALSNIGKLYEVKKDVPFEYEGKILPFPYYKKGDKYKLVGMVLTDTEQSLLLSDPKDGQDTYTIEELSEIFIPLTK